MLIFSDEIVPRHIKYRLTAHRCTAARRLRNAVLDDKHCLWLQQIYYCWRVYATYVTPTKFYLFFFCSTKCRSWSLAKKVI